METARFEKFMEAQKGAVAYLKSFPHRGAAIVHHNDTDGIASGAILREALRREGYRTENLPIERVHPAFLPRIHTKERKIILYADLGSQAGSLISEQVREGTGVIILDHHPPFQPSFSGLVQVNPESFGIDGDLRASAASVAFFWAKTLSGKNEDLAYLGVMGAIGDHQVVEGKMLGLNQMALEMARQKGALDPSPRGPESFRFPLFKGRSGSEVSREITNLAVNGYYRGGAGFKLLPGWPHGRIPTAGSRGERNSGGSIPEGDGEDSDPRDFLRGGGSVGRCGRPLSSPGVEVHRALLRRDDQRGRGPWRPIHRRFSGLPRRASPPGEIRGGR